MRLEGDGFWMCVLFGKGKGWMDGFWRFYGLGWVGLGWARGKGWMNMAFASYGVFGMSTEGSAEPEAIHFIRSSFHYESTPILYVQEAHPPTL